MCKYIYDHSIFNLGSNCMGAKAMKFEEETENFGKVNFHFILNVNNFNICCSKFFL